MRKYAVLLIFISFQAQQRAFYPTCGEYTPLAFRIKRLSSCMRDKMGWTEPRGYGVKRGDAGQRRSVMVVTCGCDFTGWITMSSEMARQKERRRHLMGGVVGPFCAERAEFGGSAECSLLLFGAEVAKGLLMATDLGWA